MNKSALWFASRFKIAAETKDDGFNIIDFKAPNHWDASFPWGGGHTVETDPTKNGWRMVKQPGGNVVVIGQKGIPCCASVVRISDYYDVAIYDEKPEVVSKIITEGKAGNLDPYYFQVDTTPGWGLKVIDEIKEARNNLEDID